jgi:cyclopropane fatty-acyl-phospholipid synthase-like methyltransferase
MKYDISLFEQLNEEYISKPIKNSFPESDPDSEFKYARSRLFSLNKLLPLEGKRILEVGCGRGYVSKVLATEYKCSVVGVDIRERDQWNVLQSESPNLEYRVLDLSNENPFDIESFDLIISFAVWEHIIHPFTMLKECCKILKPSGAIYMIANLYRAPNASHRYREVFFPFPHLLFEDEVFSEYYMKHIGKSMQPSRLNKLTYAQYKEYFKILNLRIEHERLRRTPLDKAFYERFKDKLEPYPVFDLELEFFTVLLQKVNPVTAQVDTFPHELERQLITVRDSFTYQLGNMLVRAVYKPGRNTILLPYRLTRLCVIEFKKGRARTT